MATDLEQQASGVPILHQFTGTVVLVAPMSFGAAVRDDLVVMAVIGAKFLIGGVLTASMSDG